MHRRFGKHSFSRFGFWDFVSVSKFSFAIGVSFGGSLPDRVWSLIFNSRFKKEIILSVFS